jgi:hypothetical protein
MKTCLLGLALLAQPVFAASVGQASFAPGTQVPARIVVSETLWTCADGRCTGPGDGRAVAMQRACNTLARQVGEVASLTVGGAALTPEALQACNAKAGRTAAAVAAR